MSRGATTPHSHRNGVSGQFGRAMKTPTSCSYYVCSTRQMLAVQPGTSHLRSQLKYLYENSTAPSDSDAKIANMSNTCKPYPMPVLRDNWQLAAARHVGHKYVP